MEVLSRDRELTILVDSESQRDIEQTVDDIKDIRANIALNVDGRNVDLPKDVSVIVTTVLESLSKGSRVVISTTPKELRTTAAAEMLGISRPTLLKLVREGELPSHKVALIIVSCSTMFLNTETSNRKLRGSISLPCVVLWTSWKIKSEWYIRG